ncbi:hypothetical protein PHLGIDRAFT_54030, partial [Phlebiopsis gigantea 11061_1 CR5-6]
FTPFQRVDSDSQLYQVQRSTRNLKRNACVLTADRIVGRCHLAGKCGREIDRRWTSENVED